MLLRNDKRKVFSKMIIKESPIPLYFQLEQVIKEMIEKKELKPGDLVPSEREYAEK